MSTPVLELVVGGALIKDSRLLLVQQRKSSALGLWSPPGGHIEAGETPHQALVREVREEVALTVTTATPLRIDRRPDGLEHHAFLIEATGQVHLAQDELLGFGWFTLEQLVAMQALLRAPFILEVARGAFATIHH